VEDSRSRARASLCAGGACSAEREAVDHCCEIAACSGTQGAFAELIEHDERLVRARITIHANLRDPACAMHRRVQVDPSTLELTGYDSNGVTLLPLSYDEQMAFCRLAQRVGQTITEGTLRPRIEADLRAQLAALQRHHDAPIPSHASNRPPVRVIDDLPESGQIDVPYLLGEVHRTFPGAQYVDLELQLADGRRLVGELESAPQGIVTVDLAAPPDWLSFE